MSSDAMAAGQSDLFFLEITNNSPAYLYWALRSCDREFASQTDFQLTLDDHHPLATGGCDINQMEARLAQWDQKVRSCLVCSSSTAHHIAHCVGSFAHNPVVTLK